MELFLIDAIGPFFRDDKRKRINWSKIPFEAFTAESIARERQFAQICVDMQQFVRRVKADGYNAVTLDDLAHIMDHPWYEDEVRQMLRRNAREFQQLFQLIANEGMGIYLTLDVIAFTPQLKQRIGGSFDKILQFLSEQIRQCFERFPLIDGLIIRIGECDGLDIDSALKSELVLKTPKMMNRLLRQLLPIFEADDKHLIMRTWTVGAYKVGDLIWHPSTFDKVFADIRSPSLIVSMKYGESDFFRYLSLSPAFFYSDINKLIELQAKREYEGCGEYPSFIGWDYENYRHELQQANNVIGISVWCQTGGWVPFRRLAYIDQGSLWTEINAFVTLRMYRHGDSVEQALQRYFGDHYRPEHLSFFRLNDEVIKELLYMPEFAQQRLFFRRVRIPPLLGVYWDSIFINHSMKKMMRYFIKDQAGCMHLTYSALNKIDEMQDLAEGLSLPVDDIIYMKETFTLLAMARQYYFSPFDEAMREQLVAAKRHYKKRYPRGSRYRYIIHMDFQPFRIHSRFLSWGLKLLLRQQHQYRVLDQLFTIRLLALIYRVIRTTRTHWLPKFVRKSAMGIDSIFK